MTSNRGFSTTQKLVVELQTEPSVVGAVGQTRAMRVAAVRRGIEHIRTALLTSA